MPTAKNSHITSAPFAAAAARYRALAIEADLQALAVVRTDPERVAPTEDAYRCLIVRQARYRKHARRLEKQSAMRVAS